MTNRRQIELLLVKMEENPSVAKGLKFCEATHIPKQSYTETWQNNIITVFREKARELNQLMASLRSHEPGSGIQNIIGLNTNIRMCQSEIRHSVKASKYTDLIPKFKMSVPVFSNKVQAIWPTHSALKIMNLNF